MQRAEDEQILAFALDRGLALITLDSDFHGIAIINPVLRRYSVELVEGCLISVKENRTTSHRLPIGHEHT